jgi:transcriptional antiterminator NusG
MSETEMDPVEGSAPSEIEALEEATLEADAELMDAETEDEVSEPVEESEDSLVTSEPEELDTPVEAVDETHAEEMSPAEEDSEEAPDPTDEEASASAELEEEVESAEPEEESIEAGDVEDEPVSMVEPDDGRTWYVVHCYSGYENKVRHNLEQRIETMGMKNKIFDVVVPTEEEIEVKDGKRRTVERRVFPGYILVQMIMDEDSWYVVRNTPGVTGFVGMGNDPTPLRPEEVSSIVKRMEAEAPRIKVTYKTGQKVRIIDGPFNDFIGTVADIDMERAKVRVMVSFFGRETPVELDFLQVEKA